jgi:undecaprenyl-phosphate 4-deoxy-4-formamido-L-arabinose transferase
MVTIVGLITSAIGFLLTAWLVVGKYLYSTAPHGFTTTASLITFFAGAQMLAMGIIGEYIRKIYVQTLQRPKGFIQDKVGFE